MKITSGEEWTFEKLDNIYLEIQKIADVKYSLHYYPNQLEIISSEQMIDAYSSVGLPLYYSHWSFGEQFVKELDAYKRGRMGLAYEIVINSSPCIAYLMEENTMLMQTLVISHASFGHNHFFANNYLFKQWTQPDSIISYLDFAKKYIRKCEELYGEAEVEAVIDATHALQSYGVDKYSRPAPLSAENEEKQRKERDEYLHSQLNVIWKTVPTPDNNEDEDKESIFPESPQENILYFIEKNAPRLEDWKREIIRIVRKTAQYFYPQRQTSLMNEGCLVEGSLITTEDGLMDIKTIVETQYTGNVWDGSTWEPIYDWFINENKPRIRIITNKGYEIFGGSNHKILINHAWVRLSELKVGDITEIAPLSNYEWPVNEPNIPIPPIRKHVTLGNNAAKCEQVTAFLKENNSENVSWMHSKRILPTFPTSITPALASWLGYLVGDGNVSYKNRVICLTSGDYSMVADFKDLTNKIFGEHINVSIRKDDNRYRALISNQEILRFITTELDIKIGKSSYVKEIPSLLFNATRESVSAFLRSYFDADGCATKEGTVILVSTSKSLISGVQDLLLHFNIFCSYRIQKDNTYHLVICGIDALYYRDKIGFGLNRKQDRLAILDDRKFLKRKTMAIIEKIEVSVGTTYDFSVKNSHQYYHNGLINHNCATFFHHKIMHDLYDNGTLDDGAMLEFYASHTGVIAQHDFDDPHFSGINVYALGFAMMQDIERISMDPTDEDRDWFAGQDWVGNGDWLANIKWAIENFKDTSFIEQFLSPKVMRHFRMFVVHDDAQDPKYLVSGIHNKQGYKTVREALSNQYNIGYQVPDIQVFEVDRWGDRSLTLRHYMVNKRPLDPESTVKTLRCISFLWGYDVALESVDTEETVRSSYDISGEDTVLDIFLDGDEDW